MCIASDPPLIYIYLYTSRCKLAGLLLFDSMNNYIQNFEKFQVYYNRVEANARAARNVPSLAIQIRIRFVR